MSDVGDRLKLLEAEIERRLVERFAALRDEFDRLRLESDRRWAGFLERFEQKFTGIVPPELMLPSPAPSMPPSAPSAGNLSIGAARTLDDAGNQVEALHRYLDLCREHASRVALFVSRSGTLGVWKAVGFSDHGGNDEDARRAALPAGSESLVSRILEGTGYRLDSGNPISAALGAADAPRAVLVPMVVKEKVSGALYADCVGGEEARFDPEAIALLTFVAGLVVDRLALRKLVPAPALRNLEAPPSVSSEPSLELVAEPEEFTPKPPTDASRFKTLMMPAVEPGLPKPPPPPALYGAPPSEEPDAGPPAASASWPGLEESSTPRPSASMPLGAPPEETGRPTDTGPRASRDVLSAAPGAPTVEAERPGGITTPLAPPSVRASTGARRLAGPLAPADSGDERREEARRFAKLLVSEIKLYNEKQVQEGRQHGNIYGLLKEDIDRSRQMYDERIPEDVRANSNFFYEELVRILADGKASALGI
jgi:hypothetical protein